MDARLLAEQADLRDAAAKLAADLGPHSVLDLDDDDRVAALEKTLAATGWRSLRSDGASGVDVALVAAELARGLIDVPFLGPVLADALLACTRRADSLVPDSTIAIGTVAPDARGLGQALALDGMTLLTGTLESAGAGVDLTRHVAAVAGPLTPAGEIGADSAVRWKTLGLVLTAAEQFGAARGAQALAVEYAKTRAQYGHAIGGYQAVSHPIAEGLALLEGSESILRYAAWAVDEMPPRQALRLARIAKVYCGTSARTVCETAIQVHGGIGNTWECLAQVYLRRVLAASELFPARLEDIDVGLPGLGRRGRVPVPAAGVAGGQRRGLRDERGRVRDQRPQDLDQLLRCMTCQRRSPWRPTARCGLSRSTGPAANRKDAS